MRFVSAFGALVLVLPALGVPTRIPITKRAGPVKPDSYIVTFKDAQAKNTFVKSSPAFSESDSRITHDYTLINATAMTIRGQDLTLVQSAPGVQSIEPDGIMSISYEVGLDGFDPVGYKKISESLSELDKRTDGDGKGRGEGVRIFGIDTGIYTDHNCFGGRASWGPQVVPAYEQKDGNGHGTHTAGTAVGTGFSNATRATMMGIKVLADDGTGSTSDVINGVQAACNIFQTDRIPSIVTMSLGGAPNSAVDDAVRTCIATGLHFSIAAGNSMLPAETSSPARVEEANTIGAVDYNNTQASFSNFGPLIDVWYYGVNVESAWIDGPNSTKKLSGTSMATPGVAGILAVELSKYGQMEPDVLSKELKENAAPVVTRTPDTGISNNLLAQEW